MLHGLGFERTKVAGKIFSELEDKGKIKRTITDDSSTFITLTDECKKECIENLDFKEFYSDPSLQMKYLYEDVEGTQRVHTRRYAKS
jgi:hypothetical protein